MISSDFFLSFILMKNSCICTYLSLIFFKMYLTLKKVVVNDFLQQKNISWDLKQVNVLVGKNGTGKTSLLNIIFNMLLENQKSRSPDNNAITTEQIENSLGMSLSEKIQLYFNEKPLIYSSQKMFSDLDFLDGFINIIETSQKEVEKTFENTKELSFSIEKDISKKVYINDIKKLEKLSYALSKNSIFSVKRTYSFNKKDMADNLDYNFELISTINLNANSINQYISSDGNTKSTVLDLEIQKEISKMKNHPCKNIFIDKIISSINIFFSDSNKNISFEDDDFIVYIKGKNKINISSLSSVERQLFFIFLKIVNCSDKRTIFLMDEPEISLHLEWQEKLLTEILKVNKDCQLIIVTHSPAMVMNGWIDSYIDIDNICTMEDI